MKTLYLLFTAILLFSCTSPERTTYVKEEVIYKIVISSDSIENKITYNITNDNINIENVNFPFTYYFDPVIVYYNNDGSVKYDPAVTFNYFQISCDKETTITLYRNNEIALESKSSKIENEKGEIIGYFAILISPYNYTVLP